MNFRSLIACTFAACFGAALPFAAPRAQDPPMSDEMKKQMEEMFAKAAKFIEPSEAHKKLADYLGTWDCEWKMAMGPGPMTTCGKSRAVNSWLFEGRFIKGEMTGTLMDKVHKALVVTGYDNFKQAYVRMNCDNMNTFMLTSQGKLAQDGKTMIWYGTMDEYLTGENDKMVKLVARWIDADHFVEEIHDLAIGEENTKVMEVSCSRVK